MTTPCPAAALLCTLLFPALAARLLALPPEPANLAAFAVYTESVEARLAEQHRSAGAFVTLQDRARLRTGTVLTEHLATPVLAGALLHHWRGTVFVSGATAGDFEGILRRVSAYPQVFAPEIVAARAGPAGGDGANTVATLRIRQHHVLTVVFDATYDVRFGALDPAHGYSLSRSTRIREIAAAGTADEHALSPADEHGFLWRLNTYWSWAEADGGLYLQVETVSLTRGIPAGLGWAVRPYLESIPRESLDFTLRSAAAALRR